MITYQLLLAGLVLVIIDVWTFLCIELLSQLMSSPDHKKITLSISTIQLKYFVYLYYHNLKLLCYKKSAIINKY